MSLSLSGTRKTLAAALAAAVLSLPLAAGAHGPAGEGACAAASAHKAFMPPAPGMPPIDMKMPGAFPGAGLPPHLRDLDLSEAQQDKVFDLMHGQAPQLREKTKAAFKAMEALRKLSASDRYDAAQARTLADTHARALADLVLMQADQDAKLRALLTPEQRKRLDDVAGRAGERPAAASAKRS